MKLMPRTNQIRTKALTRGATVMPGLAISFSLAPRRGASAEWPTSQVDGMTIAIDGDGGGSSQFRLTLAESRVDESGVASTGNTYIFDGATGGSGDVTAVCPTMHELIKQLNEIAGVNAWALHLPHFFSLATDAIEDLSATAIPMRRQHLSIMHQTPSSGMTCYLRIGIPEELDNGHMRVTTVAGKVTGVTAGTVKVYRDAYSQNLTAVPDDCELLETLVAAQTTYLGKDISDAVTYQGPVILEVYASNLTACAFRFGYMQGEV